MAQPESSREEATLRIGRMLMPLALSIFTLLVVALAASVNAPGPGPSWAPVALRMALATVGLTLAWTLYSILRAVLGQDRN